VNFFWKAGSRGSKFFGDRWLLIGYSAGVWRFYPVGFGC
jgi:hypothetical protein